MFPDVEVWQGELWGVLEIESYGKLSDTELNAVIAEWSGQASDGWGEGFEQRPIRTEEGDLYVSFWNSGSDYFITTEEKLRIAYCGIQMWEGGIGCGWDEGSRGAWKRKNQKIRREENNGI